MYKVVNSREITHRDQFADLCNARGVSIAIEVGTDQGIFASKFVERFEGDHLICIDSYESYEWDGVVDRLPDLLMATTLLAPYASQARIVRGHSPEIIEGIPWWIRDNAGFVYIDAAHDEYSVLADMGAWWKLPNPSLILAGHDYDETHPEVITAVQLFAKHRDATVHLTREKIPSWYIYKTEPTEYFNLRS